MYPTSYTFDRVFSCDCSTRQVYENGAKAVLLSALNGINSSVFAYGQTSSGKTFTMSGITEYTMEDIFDYMRKHKEREFHLKFSAMEIYNESVRDLLTEDNSPLRLLDDPERGTVVEKLTEESLRDWNHFKDLLAICEAQRQIAETFLNEASSRSHQILRLTIESSTREFQGKNNPGTLAATLNFVDLAGSERASQALSAGSRLKEGSHINRSLLTLGTVIRKLSKGRTGHIPFRDSKLTRILQSSLGGNARTAIICTMSPARSYVEQSRNTLLFASCAKEITTNARVNVVLSEKALVKHLQRELAKLQSELRNSSPSLQDDASDVLREKDSRIDELERQVRQLTLELDLALSQIQDLQQGLEDRSPTLWEGNDSSYPGFYARQIPDNSPSDATITTENQSIIRVPVAFETRHSPDRHSRVSYDEDYSISDFEDNTLPGSLHEQMFTETPGDASPPMCIQTSVVVGNHCCQVPEGVAENTIRCSENDSCMVSEEIGEQSPDSYESVPRQVSNEISEQASETFDMHVQQASDGHWSQSSYIVKEYPDQGLCEIGEQTPSSYELDCFKVSAEIPEEALNDGHIDAGDTREGTWEQTEGQLEEYCKKVRRIGSELSDSLQTNSLQPIQGESVSLMGHVNDECNEEELTQETASSDTNPSYVKHAEELSGKQQITDMLECKNLDHVESRSYQSNDRSCRSSISLEKVNCEIISDSGNGGDGLIATLEETRMLSALGCDVEKEDLQMSKGDIELGKSSISDIRVSNHISNSGDSTFDTMRRDIVEPLCTAQLADCQLVDTTYKGSQSSKNMKDVGLNPQDDLEMCPPWLLDSNKLQKEILDLWDTCNVSLVHRTCFFLLFINNKPADTIYMEVERRRLSLIKDAFSWGNSVVLNGRKLTPGASKKSLLHEREKLGRLMKKRLTNEERVELYTKWGINLKTKRRGSQVAHQLWIDTEDTGHILESANIVARLVQFREPQVPKEVFGLSLMTNEARRKSFRW